LKFIYRVVALGLLSVLSADGFPRHPSGSPDRASLRSVHGLHRAPS